MCLYILLEKQALCHLRQPLNSYTKIQFNIYDVEIIFIKLVLIKQTVPEMNAESPLENTS